ncbi:MAG: S46 family peptidase [Prolixibacteraceae bacterium]|jgi:hypothetical protein|nr:S46 family peptidase [Prolixibacteraceae bacterium]
MNFKKLRLIVIVLLLVNTLHADEGMWLPSLLNKVNEDTMYELGAQLTSDQIYNINSSSLKDAVISLNGGSCTGELVSDEGLFLTNHHCGYGLIQKHSSEGNNILKDGFWAATKNDELTNPGYKASFLISVEDVTAKVLANVSEDMDEGERIDSINAISSELVENATEDTHYDAKVKSFYSNNQYLLFVYETFNDIRLVGAPPHFIGKFGGDTDNWMWPRHTGDFSMFRIYTGPDGLPAEFSEENIPLKPRHYLPISLKGYKENDFAMVMGYPGSTDRYLTSKGVEFTMDYTNDTRIKVRKEKLNIIRAYMATSEKASIQYASKAARSSNYYKYSIGQNKGLKNLDVVAKKKAIEEEFQAWVNQAEERKSKYGEAISLIEEAYRNSDDDKAIRFISEALLRGPEIFYAATRYEALRKQLESKSDEEAIEAAVVSLEERSASFFKDFNSDTDQKIVAALTKVFVDNVSEKYHPGFVKTIQKKYRGNYDAWAEAIFKKSFINDESAVAAFLANPKKRKIKNDPIFKISREILKIRLKAYDDNSDDKTKLNKGYRLFLAGLREMNKENSFYPNANSTMRLTYGSVGDYEPRDGVHYDYFTTLKGYIEKEIPGDSEFDVWPRLKELYYENNFGDYADSDGTLHTCFTSNNDITGGNSGSPVINGNGELIGIAFDGNWEAMSGDIAFEPELQKCINVDIRFVLWVIDTFAGASHLVDEMTLVK